MNNDNIIKLAQTLDQRKHYALSNELVELFSKMSSVKTKEEYEEIQKEYLDFMGRIKKADSDVHDRLVKTAAFRWWDRLGDWFTGKWKGEPAREERIRQRVTNNQPGMDMRGTYQQIINTLTENGSMGGKIQELGSKIKEYQKTIGSIEGTATSLAKDISSITSSLQREINNLSGGNRNQKDTALLMSAVSQDLMRNLSSMSQQLTNPKFNNSEYTNSLSNFPRTLLTSYNKMIERAGQEALGEGNPPAVEGAPQNPPEGGEGAPQNPPASDESDAVAETPPMENQTAQRQLAPSKNPLQLGLGGGLGDKEPPIEPEIILTEDQERATKVLEGTPVVQKTLDAPEAQQEEIPQDILENAKYLGTQYRANPDTAIQMAEYYKKESEKPNLTPEEAKRLQLQIKAYVYEVQRINDEMARQTNSNVTKTTNPTQPQTARPQNPPLTPEQATRINELSRNRGVPSNVIKNNGTPISPASENQKKNEQNGEFEYTAPKTIKDVLGSGEQNDEELSMDEYIDDMLRNPMGESSVKMPNGEFPKSKQEYVDYVANEVSDNSGTIGEYLGDRVAKSVVSDIILWSGGDLKYLNYAKEALSTMPKEERNSIEQSSEPFQDLISAVMRNDPENPLGQLMS